MLKIFKYLSLKEWFLVAISMGLIVGQVWLELKMPDYTEKITILLRSESNPLPKIWKNGALMLGCALGSLVLAVIVGYLAARVGASFSSRMRSRLFDKVESFSMEEINRFTTASLITRSTNDVTQVQLLVTMAIQLLVKAPMTAIWAMVIIAGKGFEWTMATLVAVVFLLLFVSVAIIFVMPIFRRMQKLTDNVNKVTRENLMGVRVVRAYNAEDYQQEKFEKANKQLTSAYLVTNNTMAIMMPLMITIMSGLSLAVYWIGAHIINNADGMADKVTLSGNMSSFSIYGMQIIMSFMMLVMMFIMLPRALVSARRINEILSTAPTITDGTVTKGLDGLSGQVEFKNVSFKYPDAAEYVIKDINFSVKQGETIAFIGSTGSGKSTVINLVPRFFDATSGSVLIDGIDVKEYTQKSLHSKIGYVPQRAVLFKGNIFSNVAFGENSEDRSEEDVSRAVAIAQGAEFVDGLSEKYQAAVAQGGTNFSGGQKQRLAIARAVCHKPEIYIFDDSFSALDYKTDRVLREVLKKETAGVTTMIVAQRIGTIMDADQIVVLDNGRVVGKGTHRQLLADCEVYRQIATSQLSEEELAI